MSRLHSTLIALVLGSAAFAGFFAAVHTVRLGQTTAASSQSTVAARELAARRAKLDRWSRSLEQARKKRPPALPRVPKFAPVQAPAAPSATPVAATAAATSASPPVKYVQPPPVVEYRQAQPATTSTAPAQSSWSDGGAEQEDGGGGQGGD